MSISAEMIRDAVELINFLPTLMDLVDIENFFECRGTLSGTSNAGSNHQPMHRPLPFCSIMQDISLGWIGSSKLCFNGSTDEDKTEGSFEVIQC